MTVAEQIKRSTEPFTSNRWYTSFKQAFIKKAKIYMRETNNFEDMLHVSVWDFVFVDGSKLTVRLYW